MKKEVSAGAIVFIIDDGIKYLILHYEGDYWGFAKGKIEGKESEKETALREIREEAGLTDLKFIEGFRDVENYFYKLKGELIDKMAIYFLAKTKTKDIKISWEHKDYEWLSFEDALKRLKYKNMRMILTKANDFLTKGNASLQKN